MPIDLSKLKAPFDPKRVSWRVGPTTKDKSRGQALCYIDSRDVQDRLDDVCGPENWECHYSSIGTTVICTIGIKIGDEWVRKADGAGASDIEAEKGALSDAFKRAAVKWSVGRYLYDVNVPWVDLEPAGNSVKIKQSEMSKLYAALGGEPTEVRATLRQTVSNKPPEVSETPPAAKSASQKEPAPPAPNVSPEVARRAARDFANKAIANMHNYIDAEKFDEWATKNAATIARVRVWDEPLHTKLIEAIQNRYALLQPAHAG